MVVQGRWNTDSPLLQIPHFTNVIVAECNSTVLLREDEDEQIDGENARIESIYDVLDMTDAQRNHILRSLSPKQQSNVAEFCNACVACSRLSLFRPRALQCSPCSARARARRGIAPHPLTPDAAPRDFCLRFLLFF